MKLLPKIRFFSYWNELIRNQEHNKEFKLELAIDGSTYDYDDEELRCLSILNEFENFEIFYISGKKVKKKKYQFKILVPEGLVSHTDSIHLKGVGFDLWMDRGAKYEEVKELPLEFVGAAAACNFAVSKSKVKLNTPHVFGEPTFIGTVKECLSIIRPWIHLLPYVKARNTKYLFSKWHSVLFGSKILVPSFELAWRAAVAVGDDKFPFCDSTIDNFLWSLNERIKNLITTRNFLEEIKFEGMKGEFRKPEDYPNIITYYFGYFMMLVRAIFDSLAYILNWRLGNLTPTLFDLSLRPKNKKIFRLLSAFNQNLFSYLKSLKFQSFLEMMFYLRNTITHSVIPERIVQTGNLAGDTLVFKGEIINRLNDFIKHNNLSQNNRERMGVFSRNSEINIEPVLFSKYMVMDVCNKANYIMNKLSVHRKMITTSKELAKFKSLGKPKDTKITGDFFDSIHEALSFIEACVP